MLEFAAAGGELTIHGAIYAKNSTTSQLNKNWKIPLCFLERLYMR